MTRALFCTALTALLAASGPAQAASPGIVLALQAPADPAPGTPSAVPAPAGRWVGTPGFQAGETVTAIAIDSVIGAAGLVGELFTGTLACPSLPPPSAEFPRCAATQVTANMTLMAIPSLVSSLVVYELARQDGVHASIPKLQAWSLIVRAPLVTASSVFLGLALSPKNQPGLSGDLFLAILFDLASFVIGPVLEVAAANWTTDPVIAPSTGTVSTPGAAMERPATQAAPASPARSAGFDLPVIAVPL